MLPEFLTINHNCSEEAAIGAAVVIQDDGRTKKRNHLNEQQLDTSPRFQVTQQQQRPALPPTPPPTAKSLLLEQQKLSDLKQKPNWAVCLKVQQSSLDDRLSIRHLTEYINILPAISSCSSEVFLNSALIAVVNNQIDRSWVILRVVPQEESPTLKQSESNIS